MTEDLWYSDRRARWKPDTVRLLLIAESAPDDGGDLANRRFFYDDTLTGKDGLFREVVRALYDNPPLASGPGQKVPWLQRLKDDGVFLIDLAPVPVNYHRPAERQATLTASITATVAEARALKPVGVICVKQNVFDMLHYPLTDTGVRLLHDVFVPFPGSGQQKRFRERFTAAVRHLDD